MAAEEAPQIILEVPLIDNNKKGSKKSSLSSRAATKRTARSSESASASTASLRAVSARNSSKSLNQTSKTAVFKSVAASLLRAWLIIYNLASAAGWLYLLVQLGRVFIGSDLKNPAYNYASLAAHTSEYLARLQSVAVLEIAHAALGWVPSGVFSNAMQVASRLLVSWVAVRAGRTGGHWAYGAMAAAWALSDATRYLYYLSQLFGLSMPLLKAARYSLFLVLYPVGTLCEAILVFLARLKWHAEPLRNYGLLAVLAVYTPGFLFMYSHMLAQRAKHLGQKPNASSRSALKRKSK
jgi:very-long-chain (3R)-3-hydroxyacyl-CoA dehydratase